MVRGLWVLLLTIGTIPIVRGFVTSTTTSTTTATPYEATILFALSEREVEIRRKIRKLKKGKKNGNDDDDDDTTMADYTSKIRKKLGATKSRVLLGIGGGSEDDDDDDEPPPSVGTLGALTVTGEDEDDRDESAYAAPSKEDEVNILAQQSPDDENDNDDPGSLSDEDLVELVAQRMQEARTAASVEPEPPVVQQQPEPAMMTSGVGGAWQKESSRSSEAVEDVYQPKTGSWGAFPRPRDISKAYGGGRRVGPGYSNEQAREESIDATRAKLQEYRQSAGIEVESEKEHAEVIDEAQSIAGRAMQRGMYATAVSALEKVTQYCSTNSKVGGKVFLELAMAYEAIGRTEEAITVYQTLTKSRLDETKSNAKRLLYGIEAMHFMRDNVSEKEFSRSRAKTTFIDTTGLGNIASKFDDVYETAYVDLDSGYYKKLTESVVRSIREARQILVKATGPGEVERRRIVQALRSFSRAFADALEQELEANNVPEPVAVIDGKPIMPYQGKQTQQQGMSNAGDDFVLMEAEQMVENMDGEWRLQLIADKKGDGVKFFNTTVAWQVVDTEKMEFESVCPQGPFTVEQTGQLRFSPKRRILRRGSVAASGGMMFTDIFGAGKAGAVGAVRTERQVMVVDSLLLVTRGVPRRRKNSDEEKDYFAVWRRVEPGTYSSAQQR